MAITQNEMKEKVGTLAIDDLIAKGFIKSGMKIGLGTGSTAMWCVKRLASKINDGSLSDIKAVSTSFQTTYACNELGIPVFDMNSPAICGKLDLAIDGADEVDENFNLVKGGGAALLNEKIVAYNSKIYAIVADESKIVKAIGTGFALPVEIVPGARLCVQHQLEALGAKSVLREGVRKCGPVITDNGNQILDCLWKSPIDPVYMEDKINKIVGVVENGIFSVTKPFVYVVTSDGNFSCLNSNRY